MISEQVKRQPSKFQISLYDILFGDQDIPVDTDVGLKQDTQNNLITIAAVLGIAAIITALIIKKM